MKLFKILPFKMFLEKEYKNKISMSGKDHELQTPAWEIVGKYKDDPNVFITFTTIKKAGINPQSEYNTPLGLYCYRLVDTYNRYNVEQNNNFNEYPFPGNANKKYIGIIKLKPEYENNFVYNIGDESSFTEDQYKSAIQKMNVVWEENLSDRMKEYYTFANFISKCERQAKDNSPGGFLWNVCRVLATNIINDREINQKIDTLTRKAQYSRSALIWNTLMRKCGIVGCNDTGKGIIHENEPYQAVFFDIRAVELIDIIPNENFVLLDNDLLKIVTKYYGLNQAQIKNNKLYSGESIIPLNIITDNMDDLDYILDPSIKLFYLSIYENSITFVDSKFNSFDFSKIAYPKKLEFRSTVIENCKITNKIIIYEFGVIKNSILNNVDVLYEPEVVDSTIYVTRKISRATAKNSTFIGLVDERTQMYDGIFDKNCIFKNLRINNATFMTYGKLAERCHFQGSVISIDEVVGCIIDTSKTISNSTFKNCTVIVDYEGSIFKNLKGTWTNTTYNFRANNICLELKESTLQLPYTPSELAEFITPLTDSIKTKDEFLHALKLKFGH